MLTVDGRQGEGGGQVLRTCLSLSALLGRPVRVEAIRAGRPQPGLAPQHLAAVRALAPICGAQVAGDRIGSPVVEFHPAHPPRAGAYRLDVSRLGGRPSAGAVSLLLQCLLPPLLLANGPSPLTLRGGTHVAWSPSADYLDAVFLPALEPMGLHVTRLLTAAGYYPRGGGLFEALVHPAAAPPLAPRDCTRRGPLTVVHVLARTSRLPGHVGRRMAETAARLLEAQRLPAALRVEETPSPGPGAALLLTAEYAGCRAGFSVLGARGRPAEDLAAEAAAALLEHHATEAALDPHLADQLLLPAALARGTSAFTVSRVTGHLLTNAALIRRWLDVPILVEAPEGRPGRVTVEGCAFTGTGPGRPHAG